MSNKHVNIKLRRGTAAEWTASNELLQLGEPGFEKDTRKLKIGDGITLWNDLPYITPDFINIVSSGSIADLTTLQQNQIVEGTIVLTTDGVRWIYSGTGSKIDEASYVQLADISPAWIQITSKPASLVGLADIATTAIGDFILATGNNTYQVTNFAENVDDRVGQLVVAGSGISVNYNDSLNSLTISTSGVSFVGHTHVANDITNFNSSVSGLLPNVTGTGYVSSSFANNIYTISVTGLQPSGNYSTVGHTHTSSNITDFNSSVSGLIPVKDIISGTGISVSSLSGIYTITSTGSGVLADQAASLVTNVFNKTGSPIPKMTAVYINGGQGDQPTISLAQASGESASSKTYGLTAETINNMSAGRVIVFGTLTGLNTDQFNPTAPTGDVNGVTLYLSPTTPGGLTTTKPSAPNHMVAIGTIIRTHQNQGVIEVRVQNGFELEELHNVAISGVSNGQFLQYNSGSGLWLASSSGNFSSLTVNNTGVSVVGHTHTSSNITDFVESVQDTIGLSGFLVSGTGININYNDSLNTLTVSTTGLQPSGNYSLVGHTHTSSDITNFNSSVSGLLPTISNSGDNRVLTSTGSSTGINAESNITFDGNKLNVIGSISVDNLNFDTNTISSSSGNIIISPSGDGALQRDSGGDSRGVYAVDWQANRFSNTQVASGPYSIIGGGYSNISSGEYSTVGGGRENTSSGHDGTVGGGYSNTSSGNKSTVGGGLANTASANYSTIGGGQNNISSNYNSTVGGGNNNISSGYGSTVGGGFNNTSSGDYSTISGGYNNTASGYNSTVGGGVFNTSSNSYSTVGGGQWNTSSGSRSTIGGGEGNTSSALYSTVGGGRGNTSSALYSTIGGGRLNLAKSSRSSILGGSANVIAEKVRRADNITTVTNTIRIPDATAADFDNTTPNALQIRYTLDFAGDFSLTTRTVSSVTQNLDNSITISLTSNVGEAGQTWYYVSVVNTSETDGPHLTFGGGNQVVGGGNNNIISGNNSTNSVISGGFLNTIVPPGQLSEAGLDNATIAGGYRNTIKSYGSVIGGGTYNTATGTNHNTIAGGIGNTNSGYYSTIGGGSIHNIPANSSNNTIGGGSQNTASGIGTTVGGGINNSALDVSMSYPLGCSTVGGGQNNTSSGSDSTVGGGYSNTSSATYSTISGGSRAVADRFGMQAYAAGSFSGFQGSSGEAQRVDFILRNITTNNTSTTLFLNGSDARLTIPSNKALFATINIAGIIDGGSKAAHYVRKVAIKNVGGTTSLIGTVSTLGSDVEDDALYDVTITADNTNDALQINVTGKTGETIRWVAHVEGVEILYG